MPKHIADEDMLLRMGLTDKELQEIETKFSDLVKTLDAAQIHSRGAGMSHEICTAAS